MKIFFSYNIFNIKILYFLILGFLLPLFKFITLLISQDRAMSAMPLPDFATFWAGARLALSQTPDLYIPQLFIPKASDLIPYFTALPLIHPPTYLAVLAPLSTIRFDIAMLIWVAFSINFLGVSIYTITKNRIVWLVAMGTPILIWTISFGQMGCFLAASFLLFCRLFDKSPWISGIFVALLATKPHLALLFPLVLIVDRRWSVFLSSAIFLLLFILATILIFGPKIWIGFFQHSLQTQMKVLEVYAVWGGWENQQSLYGALRFSGFPHTAAITLHTIFAISVASLVIWFWRSQAPSTLKLALLGVGSVAITPYCHVHDLAFLVATGLLLWTRREAIRISQTNRSLLFIAIYAPFLVPLGIPAGFASIVILLFLTVREAQSSLRVST